MSAQTSKLLLIPTPLDFGCDETAPITDVLPLAALQAAAQTTHWICENAKSCRAFIKRVGEVQALALPLQQHTITELPREVHKKGDHGGAQGNAYDAKPLLQAALKAALGGNIALVSEAGMPAVADPGSSVVRAAHALGIAVAPFAGPSSLLMALAASGLGGQNFAFVGYLPIDAAARSQRIRELEALAKKGQTQLFIEVPHRNTALWQALLATLKGDTFLSIASGISLPGAQISTAQVADWKHRAAPDLGLPCVMAIGA